jgi:hypothetical protein
MRRLWAFALIRSAAGVDGNSQAFEAAVTRRYAELERQADEKVQREIARISPAFAAMTKKVEEFEKASGMKLEDWRLGNVGKLARRLHEISEDGYGGFTKTLENQLRSLTALSKGIRAALAAVGNPALEEGSDAD